MMKPPLTFVRDGVMFLMKIHDGSKVLLTKLGIHRQKKNIIVEDVLAKEFYEMTPASVDAIEAIQSGMSIGEIEANLKRKYPDEEIDMKQFVSDLVESGLVIEIDGQTIEAERMEVEEEGERKEFRAFHFVGKFLFQTPFLFVYVAALIFSIWILITRPEYGPKPISMLIVNSMTVNVLVWAGTSLFLLALHEFHHFLAARAFKVPSKYDIGHRFYFLVLETQMTDVWKLEPGKRIIIYLAGLMNDVTMLALSMALRIMFPEMNYMLYSILDLATFYLVIMIAFQACAFMKTDLYYVVETISGHLNLHERAMQWLKSLIRFRPNQEREPRFVKFFGTFYCGGVLLIAWFFVEIGYPQFKTFIQHSTQFLSLKITNIYFWDGVLFIVLNGLILLFLFYSWARSLLWYYRSRTSTQPVNE